MEGWWEAGGGRGVGGGGPESNLIRGHVLPLLLTSLPSPPPHPTENGRLASCWKFGGIFDWNDLNHPSAIRPIGWVGAGYANWIATGLPW